MELRQLRYLVLLEEERHFTRAAARARVAQPALSQQIRRLERELGVELVERTTRRVALTAAGTQLAWRARRALAEVDGARAEMEELAGLRSGRVTIGATQTVGPLDLSVLLGAFYREHPGVQLTLREDLSVALASAVRADALDLAFLSSLEADELTDLEVVELAAEPLVAVLPGRHPLSDRPVIALADLRDESFAVFREGATIRRLVERVAAEDGFVPRPAFETNHVSRTVALVGEGLAVAVLPRSDALAAADEARVVGFDDPRLSYRTFAAWRARRRLSPAAEAFRDLALARAGVP